MRGERKEDKGSGSPIQGRLFSVTLGRSGEEREVRKVKQADFDWTFDRSFADGQGTELCNGARESIRDKGRIG